MTMHIPVRRSSPASKRAKKKRRAPPEVEGLSTHVIGSRLRKYYQEVVQQPFPERFTALLHRLERKLAEQKTH